MKSRRVRPLLCSGAHYYAAVLGASTCALGRLPAKTAVIWQLHRSAVPSPGGLLRPRACHTPFSKPHKKASSTDAQGAWLVGRCAWHSSSLHLSCSQGSSM